MRRHHKSDNPVAKAVAQLRLRKAIIDQLTAVYMMKDGEPATDVLIGIAVSLQVVSGACQIEKVTDPELDLMRQTLAIVVDMVEDNVYQAKYAGDIESALAEAEVLIKKRKAASVHQAYANLMRA